MSGTNIEEFINPDRVKRDGEKIYADITCLLDAVEAILREVRERINAVKR